jgi:uncharacterized protein YggE
MRLSFFAAAAVALAPLVVDAQSTVPESVQPYGPTITNTGIGEVRLPPDGATITIAVVTSDTTAGGAGEKNAVKMQPVLAALRRQSLPDSAIRTSGYSVDREDVYPPYPRDDEGDSTKPPRYVARNAVRVTLTRLDALGALIDTALTAGATEISSIQLTSSKAPEARRKAIAIAVQAARADASAAAVAAGGSLGPIMELEIDPDRSAGQAFGVMRLDEVIVSGASAATQMLPDDISVAVRVRVRSKLQLRAQ